jgi:hypothetical protein
MFSDKPTPRPVMPTKAPEPPVQPTVTEEVPEPAKPMLSPEELLIQAGNFTPPKASVNKARRATVIAMLVMVVVLCAASYWLVSTI